jgi:hypothetical protein
LIMVLELLEVDILVLEIVVVVADMLMSVAFVR